jgi:drug/metabolite transporter (DMT)-like permease
MTYLILTVALMTGWNFVFRGAQKQRADMVAVCSVNYAAATVACALVAMVSGMPAPSLMTWVIGGLMGIIYVASYLLLVPSMNCKGISVVTAFVRLSVIVPVMASVLIWGEKPGWLQALGVLGAIVSLPMLTLDKGVDDGKFTRRELAIFVGLFLGNGLGLLTAKWFSKQDTPGETLYFLAILFGASTVGSFVPWLKARPQMRRLEWGWGMGLGLSNAGANLVLLSALAFLPGYVVFPVNACGGIVLTAIIAAVLWREIPGRMAYAGMVVAAAALVCINM